MNSEEDLEDKKEKKKKEIKRKNVKVRKVISITFFVSLRDFNELNYHSLIKLEVHIFKCGLSTSLIFFQCMIMFINIVHIFFNA